MMERLGKPKNQLELRKMIQEVDSTKTGKLYFFSFLTRLVQHCYFNNRHFHALSVHLLKNKALLVCLSEGPEPNVHVTMETLTVVLQDRLIRLIGSPHLTTLHMQNTIAIMFFIHYSSFRYYQLQRLPQHDAGQEEQHTENVSC